ncbi:MAG: MBL fold metallo-hydrolase [Treponema sp.]|jgi:ribonuclease BN (tRNA processing enzyme)|nr:MBL fold metallo-hydrolase [Treponema sp.]
MVDIRFYGVRGSHPVADSRSVRYGGNTSCVEIVKTNRQGIRVPIIVDAGSGLIKLGYQLAGKILAGEYSSAFPILFTHLHFDHTEGFYFFSPNFLPCVTLYMMGMKTLKQHVGTVLQQNMLQPIFPIEYNELKSRRKHIVLEDGRVFYLSQSGRPVLRSEDPLFEVRVLRAFAPSHPRQGALYYRITDPGDGSSIACIWDIESHIGGDVRVIKFVKDASLMIHDTQYTDEEYTGRESPVQGFGHSSYSMALDNAQQAGVKNLVAFHYNPRHSDAFLDRVAERYPELIMAREGLSISLDKGAVVKQEYLSQGFAPEEAL